jgi:hypothetical protein
MRKFVLAAATIVALAATVPAAAATTASAHGSGQIQFATNVESISFSAVRDEAGTATGHAVIRDISAGVTAFVDVDCLNVVGNTATISGIITRSSDPTLEGMQAIFQVVDNGEGNDPPDLMSIANIYEPGIGPDCSVPAEYDLSPLQGGNVQVR